MCRIIRIALLAVRGQAIDELRPIFIRHYPLIVRKRVLVERAILGPGNIIRTSGRRSKLAVNRRDKVIRRTRAVQIVDAGFIETLDIGNAYRPPLAENTSQLAVLAAIDKVQIGLEVISPGRNDDRKCGIERSCIFIYPKMILAKRAEFSGLRTGVDAGLCG